MGATLGRGAGTAEKTTLICRGHRLTCCDLAASTTELKLGDRVAIHSLNTIETVRPYDACCRAGLIAVRAHTLIKAP